MRRLVGVHDSQRIDVLDQSSLDFAGEHTPVADDVDLERRSHGDAVGGHQSDDQQDDAVQDDARPDQMGDDLGPAEVLFHRVLGRVTDQAARIADLIHDLIAAVDAGRAADAFVLQAIANVDASGADVHADVAVDAVALAGCLVVLVLATRGTRFAAAGVIGDNQRVLVEHHALEARVRAHVFAYLFAQEPSHAIGREGVEEDPEGLPGAEVEGDKVVDLGVDGCEVASKREAGPQGDGKPEDVFAGLDAQLARAHRLPVELDAGVTLAFDLLLYPHEDFRVDGLWTGITTEQATADCGKEEQGVGRDDQQDCEIDHVLWPEDQAENIELAFDQIEQNCLAAVPRQPAKTVEDCLGDPYQSPAPVGKDAGDGTHLNLLVLLVQ